MSHDYYWVNRFNGVEFGGPFDTQQAAVVSCVETYDRAQQGTALDIAILQVVAEGRIERPSARWVATGGVVRGPEIDEMNKSGAPTPTDRRVPRYDPSGMRDTRGVADDYTICGPGGSLYPTIEREETARRANWALWPWYVTKDQLASDYVGTEEARAFYKESGAGGYVLEPVVAQRDIPRELVDCYDRVVSASTTGDYWLIRIERVPPDLRDRFPGLPGDVHAVDYDRLPEWQKSLYGFSEEAGKIILRATAWGRE